MEKNVYQILQDWHELLKSGVITDEEFATKKKELLGGEKSKKNLHIDDNVSVLTFEEQAQRDAEYELLFNSKSWFQKNKGWLIGLGIAIVVGIFILYLPSEKSNVNSKSDIYSQSKISEKKERKLRYLFHANGGVIGYFDDGRVVPCARCSFTTGAVKYLYEEADESTRRYKILKNGAIDEDGNTSWPDKSDGWALIDYKWYEDVPEGGLGR